MAGKECLHNCLGSELQFKKLIGGTAVTLAPDANAITINSTATGLPKFTSICR